MLPSSKTKYKPSKKPTRRPWSHFSTNVSFLTVEYKALQPRTYMLGTKIFNGLPTELKNETNFNVFKKKLKNYLLCNVFYSLQDFFNNL
jgi:hypothetical protein